MKCVKCSRNYPHYRFRVLQIQTLHVRDFGKNSRIQALGDFEEFGICSACAEEKYEQYQDVGTAIRNTVSLYGMVILVGIILSVLFWHGSGALRMGSLGLAVGSGLCLVGKLHEYLAKQKRIDQLDAGEARYSCAWDCLVEAVPKKHDVNDITYIPVDEKTLALKNGDLMILYDLLPEIAVEAHKLIHGFAQMPSEVK